MDNWCTMSPDGFLGVNWSMSCAAHDGLYFAGRSVFDKLKADYALFRDVWAIADVADTSWKSAVIKSYSIIQYLGTSTFGWWWWIKARASDRS